MHAVCEERHVFARAFPCAFFTQASGTVEPVRHITIGVRGDLHASVYTRPHYFMLFTCDSAFSHLLHWVSDVNVDADARVAVVARCFVF